MRRHRALVMLGVTIALIALVPSAAFGVLQNEYGMEYAGRAKCLVCHEAATNQTTHGEFAKPGGYPVDADMYPVGRPGVGELVHETDIGFTLGGGTGLYEYLVINPASIPGGSSVAYTEVQGATRYDTAVAASQNSFATAATVVVATGESFPDALGGAGLAGAVNGPLLLTPQSSVPASVIAEIRRLGATKIYVLGGTSAVSNAAFAQLQAVAPAVRLAGGNRYETGALVAQEAVNVLGGAFGGTAFMATGTNYPDALAASPIMYAKDMPLVLVDAAGAYTLPTGVTQVKIVGGTKAVPVSVETKLGAAYAAPRIAGSGRYDTAAQVAAYGVSLGMKWDGVAIATGESFPDALAAGPAVGAKNAVMLLTTWGSLSEPTAAKLSANKAAISKCTFVGGTGAVSLKTRNQVKTVLAAAGAVDPNPFVVANFEWDPAFPETWEFPASGVSLGEAYTCGGCHHLGWTTKGQKPATGKFAATAVPATRNAWVADPASALPSPERYEAGSSIQCEICHGTGEAGADVDNHKGALSGYVKKLAKTQLLDSQVCGQCHGRLKGGNTFGYTPDQNLLTYATHYGFADVPTEATWNNGINAATGKAWTFFPNGQNRGLKHSYYSEWILSAHSYRGAYFDPNTGHTLDDPRTTPYQKEIGGHYSPKAVFAADYCANCHTGEGYAKRKNMAIMGDFEVTADSVGFMGTECVNCHIPHGAGSENGMALRKPDAEPTLAGIEMTSICEDCHNWELEVEGHEHAITDPLPVDAVGTPARDLTLRGGYQHPTREIYNGVALFEVPEAGKFMPGVVCEDCHMPATRSDFPDKTGLERHEDRSWKRYSHRMFIMEPGDAEAWGLAPWGDSCSPCHPGQTQAELQEHLEGWLDDTAAAYEVAAAAYDEAWTIADSGAEGPDSLAFGALMGRAYYNIRAYLGDGSMGAHNPEYITAGLEVATRMAKSVNGEFAFVAGGGAYPGVDYLAGTVVNGDGSGAAGAEIVITVDGEPTSVFADANGNFAFTFASTASIDDIYWKRCSDPDANVWPF